MIYSNETFPYDKKTSDNPDERNKRKATLHIPKAAIADNVNSLDIYSCTIKWRKVLANTSDNPQDGRQGVR